MLELELEIVFVSVRTEPDFLDDDFRSILLHLLGLLPLLIEVFLVVKDTAHRRIGLCTDLDEIQSQFVSHRHGF